MRPKEPTKDQAKGKKLLDQSDIEMLEPIRPRSDRLRENFLSWLSQSHPGDFQRYGDRPEISENEIKDFLKSKGIDKLNIYYLIKALRGG